MSYKHLAAGLLAFAASFGALSATTADRSPFTQGHWWDPSRAGNGFEVFNVGTTGAAIWYTFDDAGKPTWYTAQGEIGTSWTLLKHRWTDGKRAAPQAVGTFTLNVRNPHAAEVAFTIAGRSGSWNIEPFSLSGVINEVDHSGSYFNPDNSGWGLTVTEQGDVLGGVLYTYDPSGAPTWYAGFDRAANGSVALVSASGACPACAYTPVATQPAGRIGIEFRGESSLVLRNQLTVSMAAGLNIDGATTVQLGRKESTRRPDRELVSFPSDASLKAFLVAGMLNIPPSSFPGDFSSPAPSVTFSTTNLQEAGVDEADVVKTDGSRIYTYATDVYGQRQPSVRVARASNEGSSLEVLGTIPLAQADYRLLANGGLYLREGQLISVTGSKVSGPSFGSVWLATGNWNKGVTNIEIFDTTPSGLPVSAWKAEITGTLVSSRRIGDRLYVVTRFVPDVYGFYFGATVNTNPYYETNRTILAKVELNRLLPTVDVNRSGWPTALLDRASIFVPPQGTRPPLADLAVVSVIDLSGLKLTQSLAIAGGADAIYVSTSNLYVATTRYNARDTTGLILAAPSFLTTDVHKIALTGGSISIAASGSVEGMLSNDADKAAFRMSEQDGRLRVVSSNTNQMWGAATKNRLTILEPSSTTPGLLKTVSYIPNAQRPETLGKPGELVYGTRFVGDRLYAVTFKLIDPLYVVDLTNAADPKITGALELPGFSEYLHPLPNGLLLGFGKDARPASNMGDGSFAWYQGLQLSLFDVSGAAPRELQRMLFGKRGSASALLTEHHAFSSLPRADGTVSIAIPARVHDGMAPEYGTGDSAYYPWKESGLLRFTLTGSTPATARLDPGVPMITHRPVGTSPDMNSPIRDPAYSDGRSILFRESTLYIGHGQIWRQDASGNTTGPF